MNWLTRKIFGFIAGQIHKRLKMKGWVSATSGLSLICSGLGMVLSGFAGDKLEMDLVNTGLLTIGGGGSVLGLGRKFDRIQDAIEGPEGKPPGGAKAISGMILLAAMLTAPSLSVVGYAQGYSAFLGASIDGSEQRNSAGHLCGIKELVPDGVSLVSCVNMRGSSIEDPVYDFSQLFGFPLTSQGGIDIFTLGGGGVTTDNNSTAGLLEGGLGIKRSNLFKGIGLASTLKLVWSPGNDLSGDADRKFVPRISVGFLYEPK